MGDTAPPTAPFHPSRPFIPTRDSVVSGFDSIDYSGSVTPNLGGSGALIPLNPSAGDEPDVHETTKSSAQSEKARRSVRFRLALVSLAGAILVIAAIVLGVYFGLKRSKSKNAATAGEPGSPSGSNPAGVLFGDGTVVTTDTGASFTYKNNFGGYFVKDPSNPLNNDARAQSWSPPLNQSWQWGKDQVFGVNLGGWLVMEPFITPALYQKYPSAIDEWTLSTAMAADVAGGGLQQLEDHYATFITEEDFALIAGAGLNWVRLPIPFWAIDTWQGEPFLPKVSWTYALKAFEWARKYGLRICLDLHSAPGSQNGFNHSGQSGIINFLNGVMGVANAQRLLHYIRIITEFISQPQYTNVIPMFGIVNEPNGMPLAPLSNFYIEAHRMIRNITGVGAGDGPFISIHDSFANGSSVWAGFMQGSDRVALEPHPYFAFGGGAGTDVAPYIPAACKTWGPMINNSQHNFGVTTAGEWSLGFNDCGLFLHSVADQHTTIGCPVWDTWENYTTETKANLQNFAKAQMDSLQHWFFWTWKVGPSAVDNSVRAPLWSYQLGLDNGWIPANPRDALGYCASLGIAQNAPFDGTYLPWQTGGPGAGTINPADLATFGQWPPPSVGIVGADALLPTYTATGPVPTLPTYSFPAPTPAATINGGDGWFDDSDTAQGIITVAGCPYPNAWDATSVPVPTAVCTGTPAKLRGRDALN